MKTHCRHLVPVAQVTAVQQIPCERGRFDDFSIKKSNTQDLVNLLVLPDLDVCEASLAELQDPDKRRFQYPFSTCTHGGPCFSITKALPYERPNTTMATFKRYPACETEYLNSEDRRFYSQTNSCSVCRIFLWLQIFTGKKLGKGQQGPFKKAVEALFAGRIVAVKGLGGYLLRCDATRAAVVE